MLRSLTLVIAAALAALPSIAAAQDTLKWEADLATAQRIAAQTNRLVLVHFWGTWCPPCMEMEKTVFSKPGLGTALHPYYVPVKIQVEDNLNQDLVKRFQVEAFPSDIVMTADGRIVARSKGFKPAEQYVGMLNQAAQQARSQTNPTAPTAANAGGLAAAANASPYAVAPAAAYGTAGGRYDTQYTPAVPTPSPAAQPTAQTSAPHGPTPVGASRGDDRYSYYQPGQPAASAAAPAAAPTAAAPVASSPIAANNATAAPGAAGGDRYAGYALPSAPLNGAPRNGASPAAPSAPAPGPATTPTTTPAPPAVGDRYAADNRYAPLTQNPVAQNPPAVNPAPMNPTSVHSAPVNPAPAFAPPGTVAANPPAAAPVAGASSAAAIPPGVPPLALDGYCPVTVTEKMIWKKGDVKYGAIHRGHTYLFASAAEQQKFLAAPDVFSPIVSGHDPIAIVEEGKLVPGKREHGCFCDKRMVLFSSAANFEKFKADQNRYVTELQQALQTGKTLRR